MKAKICRVVIGITLMIVGGCVLASSLWAVSSIHQTWNALDYWLVWYSFFSFIGGFVCGGIGTAIAAGSLMDICG